MIITQAHVISPGDDVKALIENGMEFLDKGIGEFEAKAYKHSVISFWTAVEILLKVPLANEHWTLVCTGKNISPAAIVGLRLSATSFWMARLSTALMS